MFDHTFQTFEQWKQNVAASTLLHIYTAKVNLQYKAALSRSKNKILTLFKVYARSLITVLIAFAGKN